MPDEIDLNANEEATLDRAWEKVQGKLPPPSFMLKERTDRQQMEAVADRLKAIPAESRDWYEALVSAALDECQGDLAKALALADAEFAADPHGVE